MTPTTNPFFSSTTGYSGEQELLDSLTREQIAIYGVDLSYLPRKMLNLDKFLHESSVSAFEVALNIPMYVKTFDGYDGGMELLSKFGVRSSDQITLQMSRSQFDAYYTPFLEEYHKANGGLDPLEGTTAARPKEGDLIYFPFDDSIFEIKHVAFDTPFFQLGAGYIYEIQCERFEYSGENFSTGISEIDDTVEAEFYKLSFTMQAGGSGTFTKGETITIYDVSGIETPDLNVPDPVDPFRLYNTAGYLEDVTTVSAFVSDWDLPTLELVASDFTNVDPDQQDGTTLDVDVNKFAAVLIVGDESGASYLSASVTDKPKSFDDADVIQDEFDDIKIIDPFDTNPFGFV
ncbi:neck protein [Synechococcus phage S-H34]|uniref:Neck protein n=1 Tax=Synechococcus phage S-H34 TaxID=2718942 RepID=A0A6G8R671_9CAUD|nr:head closure Hc2 [Synechococcus phage S-H34]QIN96907.1 neck protein [Synechococcus phage S-H34]